MTCLRKNHKRSVYYDKSAGQYTKYFTPKFELKLKYWLRLRKYPGLNFAYIARKLQALGLNTPQIIEAEKYKVVTREIAAPTLREYLQNSNDPNVYEQFVEVVARILNAGISFFDFNQGNFLYKDGQFYVIDLEGYTDSVFISRGKAGVLYRIEKDLGAPFRKEIERRWVNETLAQKVSGVFQKLRGKK